MNGCDILADICIITSKLEFLHSDLEKMREVRRIVENRDYEQIISELESLDHLIHRPYISKVYKQYLHYKDLLVILINQKKNETVDLKNSMWSKIDNKQRIVDVSSKEVLFQKDIQNLESLEMKYRELNDEFLKLSNAPQKTFNIMRKYMTKFKKDNGYYYQLENKSTSWRCSSEQLKYIEHFEIHYHYIENEIQRYNNKLKELKAKDIDILLKRY